MWTILLCGIFYCLLSWLLSTVTGSVSYLMQPAVGYSGVLFAYILIECYHATVQSRSLFGFFSVPAKIYPWVILIGMQFFMPNISFVGHLSGILVGLLAVYGCMDWLMPSYEFCATYEVSSVCFNLYKFSNFVAAVDYSLTVSPPGETQGILSQLFSGLKWAVVMVWHFFSTVLFIVGCPVDSCAVSVHRWYAMGVNYLNSFSRANRSVFEIDSSSTDQHSRQLDRLEAGGDSIAMDNGGSSGSGSELGGGNFSGGTGSGDSAENRPNRGELEADRKSAREARLQKFANISK